MDTIKHHKVILFFAALAALLLFIVWRMARMAGTTIAGLWSGPRSTEPEATLYPVMDLTTNEDGTPDRSQCRDPSCDQPLASALEDPGSDWA